LNKLLVGDVPKTAGIDQAGELVEVRPWPIAR